MNQAANNVNKPSVGRFVHYVSYGTPGGEYGSENRAAVITEVHDAERGTVGLAVFNPTGVFFNRTVLQDENNRAGGTWHWPDRV